MRGGFKIFEQAALVVGDLNQSAHIWQVVSPVAEPTLRLAMQALIAI